MSNFQKLAIAFATASGLSGCANMDRVDLVNNGIKAVDTISNPIAALTTKTVNPALAELISTYDNSPEASRVERVVSNPIAKFLNPLDDVVGSGLAIRDANRFDEAALAMARQNNDIDGIVYHEFTHQDKTISMYGLWSADDSDRVIRGKSDGFNDLPAAEQRKMETMITDVVRSEVENTDRAQLFDEVSCRAHNLLEMRARQNDITSVKITPQINQCDF